MSAPGVRSRNGMGIAALVLGLFALLLCWTIIGGILFGILALIFGIVGRARAKRGEATNGGLSVTGAVLGVVGLLLSVGLVVFGVSLINSPAGKDLRQCIEQSRGDPAAMQECEEEFRRDLQP